MEVVGMAMGTLVRWRELGGAFSGNLIVDVEALMGQRVLVDVAGVILQAVPTMPKQMAPGRPPD
jgi:hypothetical protein